MDLELDLKYELIKVLRQLVDLSDTLARVAMVLNKRDNISDDCFSEFLEINESFNDQFITLCDRLSLFLINNYEDI